jgi:hypothetical protein
MCICGVVAVDELALAVATTVATKGAEALVSGARSAVAALVRCVRDRVAGPGDRGGLPGPGESIEAFAAGIARAMDGDPAFAAMLPRLWHDASVELCAVEGGVVNVFTGSGRNVVQARDIQGGVSF